MLNRKNVIGATIVLKHCRKMPNKVPLKVIDYNAGDGGTSYLPMIMVYDKASKNIDWVLLQSVTSVVSYGLPFEVNKNVKLLLKQLSL